MSAVSPFPSAPPARVFRLAPADVSGLVVDSLGSGALVARADSAVIELIGPGAVTCFQGLLTNDIEEAGDGSFVYGALLTPKGMIVVDGWASRAGATVRFTVPSQGFEPGVALLRRSVPPRLARTLDRSAELQVIRVAGPSAATVSAGAGLPVPPAPGRVTWADDVEVARATDGAPFALQVTAPRPAATALEQRLARAGARPAPAAALELSRILAGWPGLGAEVDAKTIPQEVRYDEIGGVSYTKGCYTGQETVSRLHFRGHTNRVLVGLEFDDEPPVLDPMTVTYQDHEAGRVTSVAGLPGARWIGLGLVRRELHPGAVVQVGGRGASGQSGGSGGSGIDARIVGLPFPIAPPQPA